MRQNKIVESEQKPVAKQKKKKRKTESKEGISLIKAGKKQLSDIKKEIKKTDSEQKTTNKRKNKFLKEIKNFEIKLDSVLKKEKEIESKIEEIEKIEQIASSKEEKRTEKKRWETENKRRKIEKTKWDIQEKIKETENKIKTAELEEQRLSKKKLKLEERKEKISQKMEELARKRILFLKKFLGEEPEQIEKPQNREIKKQEEEMKKAEELKRQGEEERQRHIEEIRRVEELKKKQEQKETQLLLPPGTDQVAKKIISPVVKIESQNIELQGKPGFLTKLFNKKQVSAKPEISSGKIKEPAEESNLIEKKEITNQEKTKKQYEQVSAKQRDAQKTELIKQYEQELEKQKQELTKKHQEELAKKQQEEIIIKEKYIPYIPEALTKQQYLIKQLEKEQEELKQKHRQELKRQAEEIRQRQVEELKRKEEEWKTKQEEFSQVKLEKKKKEPEDEGMKLFKEQAQKKRKDLEARRKSIEEEVRRIEQEELIREELKKKREEPISEAEIQLSEEQMEKKKEELEIRRKVIDEEVKKLEAEEQEREQEEKRKKEEKERKEKEKMERRRRTETLTEEGPVIMEVEKEKVLTEQEIQERLKREKELMPLFEEAVKHYKKKDLEKANELFLKLKEQAFEPEKEPKFFDKLLNKVPLYIKIENYLKEIERKKIAEGKKAAKAIKKKSKKEKKQGIPDEKKELKKRLSGRSIFNLFGRIRFSQPTIGIDISDHSIEILYLTSQRSIQDYGRTVIKEGIVNDGEIINQKELTEAFRLTSHQAGLPPFDPRKGPLSKAIVSLPESKTYIQVFTFDSRTNLLKKVKEKIESNIPFPINDLYWSYVESWDQNSGKSKVLCAAALKDVVDNQAYFLRSSGINPIAFDIESASIGRALLAEEKTQRATIILDIGARTTNLSIFDKKGFLSFSLTIRSAGTSFITKVADYLAVSQEKAEAMIKEKGFKKENNPFLPALEEEGEKIIKETQQSLNYYQEEFKENVEKIILAGGASLTPGINGFFQERFGTIKVETANPLEKIKRKGGMKEEGAVLYANVIGLALRAISKNPVRDGINLSPEEIKSREK